MRSLLLAFCIPTFLFGTPHFIAHRGASSEAPENSRSALQRAFDLEADFAEFDIQLSKDGVAVVMHDVNIQRTTDATTATPVSELTLTDLKQLDNGAWFSDAFVGERIPTLSEVLQMPRGRTGLMVEVKPDGGDREAMRVAVLRALNSHAPRLMQPGPIIVGSFDVTIINQMRTQYPGLRTLSIVRSYEDAQLIKLLGFRHFAVGRRAAQPQYVRALKSDGLTVWAWTIDDPARAHALVDAGLDGVITNRLADIRLSFGASSAELYFAQEDGQGADAGRRNKQLMQRG